MRRRRTWIVASFTAIAMTSTCTKNSSREEPSSPSTTTTTSAPDAHRVELDRPTLISVADPTCETIGIPSHGPFDEEAANAAKAQADMFRGFPVIESEMEKRATLIRLLDEFRAAVGTGRSLPARTALGREAVSQGYQVCG
jgi:hypothetical protein